MPRLPAVSLLLFGSGFCALVYQVAWLRLLRLIFGASTAASAAVLAIFMAGLGFGSLLLGRRADRSRNPLGLYANLELGISLVAGLSPLLVALVRRAYVGIGGTAELGLLPGTAVRLLLASLVLGLPTFLMGGTLPAVARALATNSDRGRRDFGLLYAANTLGAVTGALLTTLIALELLGIRRTVWVAALLNLLIVMAARAMARRAGESPPRSAPATAQAPAGAPVPFVLTAAALVGFVFFFMELVWYRMLAPLLGGSSYTFGLILAVALLGIGLGGLLYGTGARSRRPSLAEFAMTCALEGLFLVIPFALGDRLAFLALVLRDLGGAGFTGLVLAWTTVAAVTVLPAAVVAGYQFPLLVGLLGVGRREVGREVGLTYAWNTLGAIVGSIAGGFGLLPLLSAPGAWRLAAASMAILAAVAAVLAAAPLRARLPVAVAAAGVLLLAFAQGPTAFWRHTPIGAGRVEEAIEDPNAFTAFVHEANRRIVWEVDGLESSIALEDADGYSFLVNGKSDGNAVGDAPTQIMSGLLAAALHTDPRRALVIGLGTGSTAGWLAQVPGMERVDVIEIEPAIRRVAADCAPVNHGVLEDPKVRLVIGDGREFLLTTRDRYDIVFSEPSNPYRAGIASLFSRDFYAAVSDRLKAGGLFAQWLQGYDVDPQVVRTAYATLGSVFPSVESWDVHRSDLLLIAAREPLRHPVGRLPTRLASEPFASALDWTWGVEGVAGFYSAYLASPALADAIRRQEQQWINTDDRPILEFGFARNLGRSGLFSLAELRALARSRGEDRPPDVTLDWRAVRDARAARSVYFGHSPRTPPGASRQEKLRMRARRAYARDDLAAACEEWLRQPREPATPVDRVMVGECQAARGAKEALKWAARLAERRPADAGVIRAGLDARRRDWQGAAGNLEAVFGHLRERPWAHGPTAERGLRLAVDVARHDPTAGERLFRALDHPFAVHWKESHRLLTRVELAHRLGLGRLCVEALAPFEEHPVWTEPFLSSRVACYERTGHPGLERARRQLERYLDAAPVKLETGLPVPPGR